MNVSVLHNIIEKQSSFIEKSGCKSLKSKVHVWARGSDAHT